MRPGSPLLADLCFCLRFFTRLPCPLAASRNDTESLANFSRAVRMLPVAGALVGAMAAIAMAAASSCGFPPLLAAPLAICILVVACGAMHEDGLADCADGFFGGATREQKLEIMQDSRVGTFGAVALVLSLYLRAASLTLIAGQSLGLAAAVLIAAAALSRTVALMPLVLFPPARESGAAVAAGKPERGALATASCLAVLFALAPVVAGADPTRALAGIGLGAGAAYAIAVLAKQQIGGQTGDVAGAAQQLSEIAFYFVFAARV